LSFEIYDRCKEEPPIPLLEEIARKVKEGSYDLLIGVGGGSVMDTCKVVSVIALTGMPMNNYTGKRSHEKIAGQIIPKILIPTTSGTGAEWSINTVVYNHEANKMYIVRAWENEADRVIIDPELTARMPQRITADTGFDALSHAIEAYSSINANVFSDMMAGTAIKLIAEKPAAGFRQRTTKYGGTLQYVLAAALAMNAMVVSGGGLNHFISESVAPKARTSHGTTLSATCRR